MSANNALHIAVLGGDGIGPEVMAPAIEVLRKIEATTDLKFRFTDAPAGANNYLATGKSMPDSTVKPDLWLSGACGDGLVITDLASITKVKRRAPSWSAKPATANSSRPFPSGCIACWPMSR